MMPCPSCAGRMVFQTCRPIAPELEDTVYACRGCGTELVRTTMRRDRKPVRTKSAEAA